MGYSAIAHIGFMLLGLGIGSLEGFVATIIYAIIYMILTLNTFSIILNNGYHYITELSGFSRLSPVLAITLALALLSVAGIPPLAGFYSKYIVLLAAVDAGVYILAMVAIVASVIGGFYYVRIVKLIYFNDSSHYLYKSLLDTVALPTGQLHLPAHRSGAFQTLHMSLPISLILGFTLYLILTILIFPLPLLEFSFPALLPVSPSGVLLYL